MFSATCGMGYTNAKYETTADVLQEVKLIQASGGNSNHVIHPFPSPPAPTLRNPSPNNGSEFINLLKHDQICIISIIEPIDDYSFVQIFHPVDNYNLLSLLDSIINFNRGKIYSFFD